MDGSENKSQFEANAILEMSLALLKSGVIENGVSLCPHIAYLAANAADILWVTVFNVINNGSCAARKPAMQHFMILPLEVSSFQKAMGIGTVVYHNLKNIIRKKYRKDATDVSYEGWFTPNILKNTDTLEYM